MNFITLFELFSSRLCFDKKPLPNTPTRCWISEGEAGIIIISIHFLTLFQLFSSRLRSEKAHGSRPRNTQPGCWIREWGAKIRVISIHFVTLFQLFASRLWSEKSPDLRPRNTQSGCWISEAEKADICVKCNLVLYLSHVFDPEAIDVEVELAKFNLYGP